MSNVPLKDLKYSRFYVRSVYCSWKIFSDLNQNGCEIVRATVITILLAGSWLLCVRSDRDAADYTNRRSKSPKNMQ